MTDRTRRLLAGLRSPRRTVGAVIATKAGICILGVLILATGQSQSTAADQPPSATRQCAPVAHARDAAGLFRDCIDTPELVALPAGRFHMGETGTLGSYHERPVHEVEIAAFAIGKYEVTFDEWDACRRAGACAANPDDRGWGRGRRPVINVSWTDAQQYVQWLSRRTGQRYRLPSEAEWEYASRAGTETRHSWGEGSEWACAHANVFDLVGREANPHWGWHTYCKDGYAFTAPVGSYKANPWGLHDLAGNVWEWVEDCWHRDYTAAPGNGVAWTTDGDGDCRKRVNRGGGWGNHPRSMRSAARDADPADARSDAMGFRVARDLPTDSGQ